MIVSCATSLTLSSPHHTIQEYDLKEIGVVVLYMVDEEPGPDILLRLGGVGLGDLEDVFDFGDLCGLQNRFFGHCATVGFEGRPIDGLSEEMSWSRVPSQLRDFRIARRGQESIGICKAAYRNCAR